MVGPARKREAVRHVEGVLEVSERRACRTTRQPRSTQRYRGRKHGKDAVLAAELRRISAAHPRAGYRMATALLRRAGMEINAKRVQRLWRQEGLRVPRRQRQRARLGNSENGTQRLSAQRVNQVWSYAFVMDQTEDGRRLKWLPICDFVQPRAGGAGSRAADGGQGCHPHPGPGGGRARVRAGVYTPRRHKSGFFEELKVEGQQ